MTKEQLENLSLALESIYCWEFEFDETPIGKHLDNLHKQFCHEFGSTIETALDISRKYEEARKPKEKVKKKKNAELPL